MKALFKYITICICLTEIILSSCATGSQQTTEVILPESTRAIKTPKDFTINSFYVQTPNNTDYFDFIQDYSRNNIRKFVERSKLIEAQESNIRSARTWKDAHAIAQNFAAEIPNLDISFDVYQNLSCAMLYYVLLEQEPTIETQKAIEYYLDILLEYKNYHEVNIIARSLVRLSGYWSDTKIANVCNLVLSDFATKTGRKSDMVSAFFQYYAPHVQKSGQAKYVGMAVSDVTASLYSTYKQSIHQRSIPEFSNDFDARKNPNIRIGLENYYGMAIIQLLATELPNNTNQKQ